MSSSAAARDGPVRVERVDLHVVAGASLGAANAGRNWRRRRGLLLRLHAHGLVGHGEASPLPDYSPDTFEQAFAALEAWRPEGPIADLASVRAAVASLAPPSARFAAETALLDLLGQRQGKPMHELLAGSPALSSARSAALVELDLDDPSSTVGAGSDLLFERGFGDLKIKIGRPGRFADELRALEALRGELGQSWRLRLDANGLLEPDSLHEQLDALAGLSPDWLEEPVPWPALGRLERSPVPLAIDEALRLGWRQVKGWLRSGGCSAAVLKPLVLGGLLPCLRLAEQARALGLATIASHGFDGPVALQATCHLALALDARPGIGATVGNTAHGTAPHGGLDAWPAVDGLLCDGPSITAGGAAGLGLDGLEDILGHADVRRHADIQRHAR